MMLEVARGRRRGRPRRAPQPRRGGRRRRGRDAAARGRGALSSTLGTTGVSVRDVLLYPDRRLKEVAPLGPGSRRGERGRPPRHDGLPGHCVGLAAPQIGEAARVAVVDVTEHPRGADRNNGRLVLVNLGDRLRQRQGRRPRGLPSIPDLTANVRRAKDQPSTPAAASRAAASRPAASSTNWTTSTESCSSTASPRWSTTSSGGGPTRPEESPAGGGAAAMARSESAS